jgi:methionyl-tRNA formyltransferase
MKLIILTSVSNGLASRVLPELHANKNLSIIKVVFAHNSVQNKKSRIKRVFKKTMRIGILGALNGIRLRKWYFDGDTDDIRKVCESLKIPLQETDLINCEKTRQIFHNSNADLGLSLGNGYIGKSIFSIPRFGMINVHTEILPNFQGAQSIIWPIYEKVCETGLTIHQIDSKIDTGKILHQLSFPIKFYSNLRETVEKNLVTIRTQVPKTLSYVCENYRTIESSGVVQQDNKPYTTPSFWQFLRMIKNHHFLSRTSN